MAVKPELKAAQAAPPAPIRVILDNDGALTVDVTLTLKIAGADRDFKLGDKTTPAGGSKSSHVVKSAALIDSVYYLHEWGPANAFDAIEVTVKDPNGQKTSATSAVV
jgi:hypothetical protein